MKDTHKKTVEVKKKRTLFKVFMMTPRKSKRSEIKTYEPLLSSQNIKQVYSNNLDDLLSQKVMTKSFRTYKKAERV